MQIQAAHPLAIWLILPVTLHILWMARRLTLMNRARRIVAICLHLLVAASLIGALAGLRVAYPARELIVQYVIDRSESIPETQRELARAYIQKTLAEMGIHDRAGIIVFGRDAALEQNPEPKLNYSEPKALIDRSRSDLERAIDLAKACYVGHTQRRMVILSDGNQNAGDALAAARAAAAAGIVIDVFPLKYENRNDVILEKAIVETRVNLDEPFDIKVLASTSRPGRAKLSIHQDGKLLGEPMDVDLEANKKNVYVISTHLRDPGFHNFEVQLDAEGDSIPENNRAYASTYGQGTPSVLYVDGDEQPSPVLPAMLQSEKINLNVTGPAGLPNTLRDLQKYDAVIFNNVTAGDVSGDQMKMIEYAVHDVGMGFMMIGGSQSFGAGGYNQSPIERILPVEMELKNEKIMPQGALVPIIHTVEIPEGQYWAEQIVHSALDVLSPRDLMGVLYYSWEGGEKWLFPLQETGNKTHLHSIINSIQPGDMPSFDRTLQMAYDALVGCGASVKHIVVISDGDPQTPNQALAQKIKDAHISISTVCINPHSPRDANVMQDLARFANGNFYNVTSYNNLPQIFVKEAATIRKSLIIEEPFTPVAKSWSALLTGVGPAYPALKGYVGTTIKPLADLPLLTHHQDPLLAHWRHGLGKTVAFTSDAKPLWAAAWLDWPQFSKFWAQAVRWTLRSPFNQNYHVQMDIDGANGKVIIDAVDAAGKFRNLLRIKGRVITPALEPIEVSFRQTGPGRYEAGFDATQPGAYVLGAAAFESPNEKANAAKTTSSLETEAAGSGELITASSTLSYSPEFQNSRSNEALLYELADLTKGRVLDKTLPVFVHDQHAYTQPRDIWHRLLVIGLLLFLADVFVRRVMFGWGDFVAGAHISWRWLAAQLRPARVVPEAGPAGQLLQVKQEVRSHELTERINDAQARERFLAALRETKIENSVLREAREEPAKITAAAETKSTASEKKDASPTSATFTSQLLKARRQARGETPEPEKREDER